MTALAERTENNLKAFEGRRPRQQMTHLHIAVSALAEHPDVFDEPQKAMAEVAKRAYFLPQIMGLFKFGIHSTDVHNPLEQTIARNYFSLGVDVFEPLPKDGSDLPDDAESSGATLLGITGVRKHDADSRIIFDGLVVPEGLEIIQDNVEPVYIDPRTGHVHKR